ncbi:GntR family transcriptional regulator [Pseudonocardia halophobica]|uniref:GntR family transcriptional regulator n=1 Tax=Pseudonocardia halophobica TaxID=29401 RepID=UPI003D8FCA89
MVLQPIGRVGTPLADEAYRRISEAMLAGDLPPGSRLVMDTIAERLGISRTPVRDALRRLEREGLVEPTGRKGYTVRAIAAADLAHLYDSRIAVEAYSARRVAELGEPAIRTIEAVIETAVEKGAETAAEAYHLNRLVHRSVVEATANPILVELFDSVWDRAKALQIFEQFHTFAHDGGGEQLSEHYDLTAAMRVGPDQAFAVMERHIVDGFGAHRNGR